MVSLDPRLGTARATVARLGLDSAWTVSRGAAPCPPLYVARPGIRVDSTSDSDCRGHRHGGYHCHVRTTASAQALSDAD